MCPQGGARRQRAQQVVLPQAARGVPQHQGGVELQLVLTVEGGAAPSGVRDDHSVGQSN